MNPVAGNKRNMFTYLPDEVIVHMCCYMDTYSLLKFGGVEDTAAGNRRVH